MLSFVNPVTLVTRTTSLSKFASHYHYVLLVSFLIILTSPNNSVLQTTSIMPELQKECRLQAQSYHSDSTLTLLFLFLLLHHPHHRYCCGPSEGNVTVLLDTIAV